MLVEELKKISATNEILEDCDDRLRRIQDTISGKSLPKLSKLEKLENDLQECLDKIEYWNNRKDQIELKIMIEGLLK